MRFSFCSVIILSFLLGRGADTVPGRMGKPRGQAFFCLEVCGRGHCVERTGQLGAIPVREVTMAAPPGMHLSGNFKAKYGDTRPKRPYLSSDWGILERALAHSYQVPSPLGHMLTGPQNSHLKDRCSRSPSQHMVEEKHKPRTLCPHFTLSNPL